MKQLRLLTSILCLTTATLVVLVSHGMIEIIEVWHNMLLGKVFNASLFIGEWVFILFIILFIWLMNFNSQEVILINNRLSTNFKLLMKRKDSPHLNLVSPGKVPVFGKIQPLDEHEILAFRQMIEIEKGPSILLNDIWKLELDKAISETVKSTDLPQNIPSNETKKWLVMDLEEVAGTEISESKNPLNQDISKLLIEQEHFVFNVLDIQNQNKEENFIPPSLKVVYRSKESSMPPIAESLKRAWESKLDIAFYKKLIEACDK